MAQPPGQACENCHFSIPANDEQIVYICHRYPPTITHMQGAQMTTNFPIIRADAWCGEWKQGLILPGANRSEPYRGNQ